MWYGSIFTLGFLLFCACTTYPLKRVDWNGQEFVQTSINDSTWTKNMTAVLKHYNEPFKIEEGRIFINKKLYNNKELLYNYSTKVKDSVWLKQSTQR